MKKIIECILWAVICVIPAYVQAQDTTKQMLSITECINLALKNDLDIQESAIQSEIAHVNWQERKANHFLY